MKKSMPFGIGAVIALFCVNAFAFAHSTPRDNSKKVITVSSISRLAIVAARDGHMVKMTPGVYKMADYFTAEIIKKRQAKTMQQTKAAKKKRSDAYMFCFSGNDNVFDFTGVTIEVDTKFLSAFKGCYVREFLITGNNNTIKGLTITDIGNKPTYKGGNSLSVHGDDNTLENVTLNVRGSSPYGYGDYLGKGDARIVRLQKHSGLQICGVNTKLIGCKVITRSFGHAFYIQGAINTYFENCYAEGAIRSTDEMLAETSGPAFEHDFASVYKTRTGEKVIPPGYMKSLNECGFRTYGSGGPAGRKTGKVTAVNCKAKNVRVGFALGAAKDVEPVTIQNCWAIGCERGYNVNNCVIENSGGDAKYGPLLYLKGGENARINLELMADESDMNVHAVATIAGKGHQIIIKPFEEKKHAKSIPIMLGYGMPNSGENASPIPESAAENITLVNKTGMPVEISKMAKNSKVVTSGPLSSNEGNNIEIVKR